MFTDIGFHLKSGFKKSLCSHMLVFTIILDSQKYCVHQFFLYRVLVKTFRQLSEYCTDATVGDGFAPLGPPLLPWENRMGRRHTNKQFTDIATTRPKRPKGGFCHRILSQNFCENEEKNMFFFTLKLI